ncbi:MAG TPA: ATP-binding protein [Terriglobales bacterium]|nr:ATP-binding protein [Terriglobales bacterium]
MFRHSIQRRLIAAVVLSQSMLATGLLLAGVYFTHRQLMATLQNNIQARATSLTALVRYTEQDPPHLIFDGSMLPPPLDAKHPDLYLVTTDQGTILARSPNWFEAARHPGDGFWTIHYNGTAYRVVRLSHMPVLDSEPGQPPAFLNVIYASPTEGVDLEVRITGLYIALAGAVLLAITVPLALWGIRRGLLPMQRLAGQAALVSAQNWQFQAPEEIREIAELEPLTHAMSTMVDRLHRSFLQQREFLGNAAHELKTPVAILKSTLQAITQKPRSSEEYRQGIALALEDMERLENLLHWMLRLARAEQWAHGALRRDLPTIDIAETCAEAIERLRPLTAEHHIAIHFVNHTGAFLRADPEDLQLIWVNLLENAIRYSPEGSSVDVAVSRQNGGPARILFEDHGVGVPPDQLPHIFERFHRGDPSRTRATGGFGLGLAIAKALVEAYGGHITASSTVGKGTRITVELPILNAEEMAHTAPT